MTNPLTSLDELIWKQFEKVTQYAQKNYGRDKWDLASLSNWGNGASLFGGSFYLCAIPEHPTTPALSEWLTNIGIFGMALGVAVPYIFNKLDQYKSRKELYQLIRYGSVKEPYFSWKRPLGMYVGTLCIITGGFFLRHEDLFVKISGLSAVCSGLSYEFLVSSNYFSTQLPTPPSTKKPFWKITYEGIRNKFKPRPQLEPVAEPAPQYVTIDTLVT